MKVKIDPRKRGSHVTVTGDALEVELPAWLQNVADAFAERLKRAIREQPEGKWNRTGELLRSIKGDATAEGRAQVKVTSDRLERDPELATKFRDEVMPVDPIDRSVRNAIAETIRDSIKKVKR